MSKLLFNIFLTHINNIWYTIVNNYKIKESMWNNCETNYIWDSIKSVSDYIWYDNWETLKYSYRWESIDFTFYKDGWVKIERDSKLMRLNVELNNKKEFNEIIWSILNNLTNNDPNRKRIWREVNNVYDLLTWKIQEKEDIIQCQNNSKSELLSDIINTWEIIWDFIYNIIQDVIFEYFWDKKNIMEISWKDLLNNKEFMRKINIICEELWCNTMDLLIVMHAESRINPRAVNKLSNATALIQFMPKTAKGLWTTVEELFNMSPIEQLKYVKIFLDKNDRWKKLNNTEKVYASVFYPEYLNHIDANKSFVFWSENSLNRAQIVAEQNPAISRHSKRSDKLIDWYAFSRYVKAQKNSFNNTYQIS